VVLSEGGTDRNPLNIGGAGQGSRYKDSCRRGQGHGHAPARPEVRGRFFTLGEGHAQAQIRAISNLALGRLPIPRHQARRNVRGRVDHRSAFTRRLRAHRRLHRPRRRHGPDHGRVAPLVTRSVGAIGGATSWAESKALSALAYLTLTVLALRLVLPASRAPPASRPAQCARAALPRPVAPRPRSRSRRARWTLKAHRSGQLAHVVDCCRHPRRRSSAAGVGRDRRPRRSSTFDPAAEPATRNTCTTAASPARRLSTSAPAPIRVSLTPNGAAVAGRELFTLSARGFGHPPLPRSTLKRRGAAAGDALVVAFEVAPPPNAGRSRRRDAARDPVAGRDRGRDVLYLRRTGTARPPTKRSTILREANTVLSDKLAPSKRNASSTSSKSRR